MPSKKNKKTRARPKGYVSIAAARRAAAVASSPEPEVKVAKEPNGVGKRKKAKKPSKPAKIVSSKRPRRKDFEADIALGRAQDGFMPAFRDKKAVDLTRKERNALSAHFMRQNRRRKALEKGALEFNSIVSGSVLLATVTGGGTRRGGRIYVTGSGRVGDDFFEANIGDIIANSSYASWREAKKLTVREFVTAMSDGARHAAAVQVSARSSAAKEPESEEEEEEGAGAERVTSTEEDDGEVPLENDDSSSMEDV